MEIFDKVLLTEKFTLILLLLVTSFINGHHSYVSEKPRRFIGDCVVSGATGAIAFAVIARMRKSDHMMSVAMSSFLILFMLNVLTEFSGFNSGSADSRSMSDIEKKEVSALKWPVLTLTVVGLLILAFLAYKKNVPLVGSSLPKEALIFGIASGLSAAYVTVDHGASSRDTALATFGSTGFFALLHIALQKGGFYRMVF